MKPKLKTYRTVTVLHLVKKGLCGYLKERHSGSDVYPCCVHSRIGGRNYV